MTQASSNATVCTCDANWGGFKPPCPIHDSIPVAQMQSKRPSDQIRERATELMREWADYAAAQPRDVVILQPADDGYRQATLEYLDQLAGFPKSDE